MPFIVSLLLYAGAFLLNELLRPKPNVENARPAGLGDFQVPTAEEGRVIPLLWGTNRVKGPNVTWFGDLRAEPITEKIRTSIFSSTRVTVGFRYFLGIQFSLGRGPLNASTDGIRRIWIDDKEVFNPIGSPIDPADAVHDGAITIDKPDFNGEDSDLIGTLRVYPGTETQTASTYLSAVDDIDATLLPAYRGTVYCVFEQGEIGQQPSVRPWSFEITRIPDGLNLAGESTPSHVIDGRHANPMNVLYEILTNQEWGSALTNVDTATLIVAGNKLFEENHGFSMVLDSPRECSSVIEEIERQVDGRLYFDEVDGLYKFRLVREFNWEGESPQPEVLQLNDANVDDVEFDQGVWEDTTNHVKVGYEDPEKDYAEAFAIAIDGANTLIQQANITATPVYPGVKQGSLANVIAWRELRLLSYPLQRVRVRVNRDASLTIPTDVFDLTWSPRGIANVRFRVTGVQLGDDRSGLITIDATIDLYQTEQAVFGDPPETQWIPFDTTASDAIDPRIVNIPAILVPEDVREVSLSANQPMLVATRPNSLHVTYDVVEDIEGLTESPLFDGVYEFVDTVGEFTPSALLSRAVTKEEAFTGPSPEITVDGGTDLERVTDVVSVSALDDGPVNLALIDDEIVFFESLQDNGGGSFSLIGTRRGMLGTIPADHADNARVYFFTYGAGLYRAPVRLLRDGTGAEIGRSDDFRVKFLTTTPAQTLAEDDATTIEYKSSFPLLYQDRPFPPRNPTLDGTPWYLVSDLAGSFALRWLGASREQSLAVTQESADEPVPGSTSMLFTVTALTSPEQVVLERSLPTVGAQVSPAGGQFNASGFVIEDTTNYRIRLEAQRAGFGASAQAWERDVTLNAGYGLNYGNNYGGLNTEGVNLQQGDAPRVDDPFPGLEVQATVDVTFSGGYNTADVLTTDYRYFDQVTLESGSGTFEIDVNTLGGSTLSDIVDAWQAQLENELPSIIGVTRVSATQVRAQSSYGSLDIEVRNSGILGSFGGSSVNSLQEPAASNVLYVPSYQYIDYFEQEQGQDVLAASVDASYNASGNSSFTLEVVPVTYEGKKAFDFFTSRRITITYPENSSTGYLGSLDPLLAALQDSPANEFFAFAIGQHTNYNGFFPADDPMDRQALLVWAVAGDPTNRFDYVARTTTVGEIGGANTASDFSLCVKTSEDGVQRSALDRVYHVTYGPDTDANFVVGQTVEVGVAGNTSTYVLDADDVAKTGPAVFEDAFISLAADITALSGYTSEILYALDGTTPRALEIRRPGNSSDYSVSTRMYNSGGVIVTVTES
jgi:hypothetical protein